MDSARDSAPGSENPGPPKILDKNFDFLVFFGGSKGPPLEHPDFPIKI